MRTKAIGLFIGMSQRDALRIMRDAGFVIRDRHGKNEWVITPPRGGKPIVLRRNRKDIPSEVVMFAKRSLAG